MATAPAVRGSSPHPWLSHTPEEQAEMLRTIGVSGMDDLFQDLPPAVRLGGPLQIPPALAEGPLLEHLSALAARNGDASQYACFLGGGAYLRFTPSVVKHLIGRSEFYTAYTPYQPEASQGLLQAFYEYQTLMCQLTGMDVSNASLYEGASALAEAVLMASRIREGRRRVLVASTVHPEARQVLRTYCANLPFEIVEIPREGKSKATLDLEWLKRHLDDQAMAVVVQQPNVLGYLEQMPAIGELAQKAGAVYIASVEPVSLGLLLPPGAYGADIAVGEGQGLGIPLSFGGPYLGFLACKKDHVRKVPGRLVGATLDHEGRRGYVLTLQAREQHIRREKATSNICTNEALCALAATVHLATLGPQGLREAAWLSLQKAHYLADRLAEVPGVSLLSDAPFFQEFAYKCEAAPGLLNERFREQRILGGIELGRWVPELADYLLVCATEVLSRADLDRYVDVVKGA